MKNKIYVLLFFVALLTVPPVIGRRRTFRARKNKKPQEAIVAPDTLAASEDPTIEIANEDHNIQEQEKKSKEEVQQELAALHPKLAIEDLDDKVEINLEKTSIINFLKWISDVFGIQFLTPNALDPIPQNKGKLDGNITFKTQKALNKAQVWDLFLTFLDFFNFALVPKRYEDGYPVFYEVIQSPNANKEPVPTFIGTDYKDLPDNDTKIRYVYFVQNSKLADISDIIGQFISTKAQLNQFPSLNAIILTDKASNIKSLMRIVTELDRVSMPEALSVLKLKHADAKKVAELYQQLVEKEVGRPTGTNAVLNRIYGRKIPTAIYFPENTKVVAEERTNALIILGNKEGIQKVEEFVVKYIDTELKQPYSPLYVYDLQYANATSIADILDRVTQFGATEIAAKKYGGVRDGDKYLQKMTFIAEPMGNRLLIKAEKEDYLKVRDVIKKLDVKQPQIGIEVLIVEVLAIKNKQLGTQLRNKRDDTLGKHVDFQTSGFPGNTPTDSRGIVINPDTGSIMGNLIQLAIGQGAGSTIISIGSDLVGGIWAIFKMLQTYTHTNIVSHPFLITTNKYTAQVSLGETRRVQIGQVFATSSASVLDDAEANLTVKITPQINSNGIINMEIDINITTFNSPTNFTSATRTTKKIKTTANLANKEILALGGLLRSQSTQNVTKVPTLGNIPLFGWFFKNKNQEKNKDNLLIFISPQIIEPRLKGGMSGYSKKKAHYARDNLQEQTHTSEPRDPIHRWFFKDIAQDEVGELDAFTEKRSHYKEYKETMYYQPIEDDSCEKIPVKCAVTQNQKKQKGIRSITNFLSNEEVIV